MAVIEADGLSRTFRARSTPFWHARRDVDAVRGVSLRVERGELYGLLGPNGAGKTTTIKMLITLLLPTSGSARVLGLDVLANPRAVRRRIGYAFGGDRGLYERLSALDNLRFFAELYGVPPREQRARIRHLLEQVDLGGRERERVENFSGGMRQRLQIARSLLHDPDVLFLDEPFVGVDPVGAKRLRTMIAALTDAGKTVLLTTHSLNEAEELCDRVAVVRRGEIVAEGTPAVLRSRVRRPMLEVEASGVRADVVARIGALRGVRSVGVHERDRLLVRAQPEIASAVLDCLSWTPVDRMSFRTPTLEDAYVELVGSS